MTGSDFNFPELEWIALALVVLAPFGLWKVVEIVIWIVQHLTISIHA